MFPNKIEIPEVGDVERLEKEGGIEIEQLLKELENLDQGIEDERGDETISKVLAAAEEVGKKVENSKEWDRDDADKLFSFVVEKQRSHSAEVKEYCLYSLNLYLEKIEKKLPKENEILRQKLYELFEKLENSEYINNGRQSEDIIRNEGARIQCLGILLRITNFLEDKNLDDRHWMLLEKEQKLPKKFDWVVKKRYREALDELLEYSWFFKRKIKEKRKTINEDEDKKINKLTNDWDANIEKDLLGAINEYTDFRPEEEIAKQVEKSKKNIIVAYKQELPKWASIIDEVAEDMKATVESADEKNDYKKAA